MTLFNKVILVTGGPRNDSKNIFGHTAIAIGNKVYSFGTSYVGGGLDGRDWGVSLNFYLKAQNPYRKTHKINLTLTHDQITKLKAYLNSNIPDVNKYGVLTYDCVAVISESLKHIGYIHYSDTFSPPARLFRYIDLKEGIRRSLRK